MEGKYALFVLNLCDDCGGMDDLLETSDNLKELITEVANLREKEEYHYPAGHIFDFDERRIILRFTSNFVKTTLNKTRYSIVLDFVVPEHRELAESLLPIQL